MKATVLVVFIGLVGVLTLAKPIRHRPDGIPTIMEMMHPGGALDDGAMYHADWFTEAKLGDPSTALGYFLTDAAQSDGAVCLDGTASAYYHRAGIGSGAKKWYIHQQGGGWCESLDDCYGRAQTDLGSSKNYPKNASLGGGYFDINPAVNPMMYNWNSVLMRYCDGNSFSGNNASTTDVKGMTLHWRGKHVLDAQIADMVHNRGLKDATDVIVSGCSAGGLATFLHCDYWAENLRAMGVNAKIVCMPDSGFFLDYQGPPQYHTGMTWAFYQQNSTSGVNQDCIAAHTASGNPSACMFAEHTAPFIKTPTFPLQGQYDSWQTANDLGSNDPAVINVWGRNLTTLVQTNFLKNPVHGIFLDSCFHHCGAWGSIRIDGDVQATALEKWYSQGSAALPNKGFYNQNQAYPCADCCKA